MFFDESGFLMKVVFDKSGFLCKVTVSSNLDETVPNLLVVWLLV